MKKTKIISGLLYWSTKAITLLCLAVTLYAGGTLLFKTTALHLTDKGQSFEIFFPFTQQPFLLGSYNTTYIVIEFLLIMCSYVVFFGLLSNVFRVFTQDKLFTQKAYNHLKQFYLANLFVPIPLLLLFLISSPIKNEDIVIGAMHFLLGVFIFFMASIFKKGLELQDNQDLII